MDKARQKPETKAEARRNKLFEKTPGTGILVMIQQQSNWKYKFDIFDESQEIKYTVTGELVSIKHRLHICDANGAELARIKEKLISLRKPISGELDPVDLIIEIGGTKVGTVKSKGAFGKQMFTFDYNGWHIVRNSFSYKYRIFNGSQEIATISQKLFTQRMTYVINFPDPNNEFIVLMLAIAIEAANATMQYKQKRRAMHEHGGD